MFALLFTALSTLKSTVRSRTDLLLEIAALRHQLEVLRRQTPRPRVRRADRAFWVWLCRTWPRWRSALVIVKPETVAYYNSARPHQGIEGFPEGGEQRATSPPGDPDPARLVARPILGGVHHDYRLAA